VSLQESAKRAVRLVVLLLRIKRNKYSHSIFTSLHKKELTSSKRKNPAKLNKIMVHGMCNKNDPTNNSYIVSLQESAKRAVRPLKQKKDPVSIEMLLEL
jgi:hypothetical protein